VGDGERTLEEQVRRVADRLEIMELMSRWHQCTDVGAWEEFRDRVLAEDFEWVWRGVDGTGSVRDVVQGRDEFIEWDTKAMSGVNVRHFVGGQVFLEHEGDHAQTRCYMHVVDVASLDTIANGLIVADHVRTPDGWRVRRLKLDEQIMEGGVGWMRQLIPDRLEFEPAAEGGTPAFLSGDGDASG
jgi:hypothetical protein